MVIVKYEVVQHDGGWAYKAGGALSETYRTHDAALKAAEKAAAGASMGRGLGTWVVHTASKKASVSDPNSRASRMRKILPDPGGSRAKLGPDGKRATTGLPAAALRRDQP